MLQDARQVPLMQAFYKTKIPEEKVSISTPSLLFSFKKTEKQKATLSRNIIYRKQPVKIVLFFLPISSRKLTAPPSLVHNTRLLHGSRICRLQIKPKLQKPAPGSSQNDQLLGSSDSAQRYMKET